MQQLDVLPAQRALGEGERVLGRPASAIEPETVTILVNGSLPVILPALANASLSLHAQASVDKESFVVGPNG
jgi:hypothetical protein